MKKAELLAEQARLQALANEMALEHWGVEFTGTVRLVNYRWSCTNGRYRGDRRTGLQEIKMSAIRNAERTPDEVRKTLLHELVHWRLHSQELPSRDTDDEFIVECLRVGASISRARSAWAAYEAYLKKTEGNAA